MFKGMCVNSKRWHQFRQDKEAKSYIPAYKIIQLLSQNYVFQLLEVIVDNSFNHLHSEVFKILTLIKDMLSTHGGVSPFTF